MKKLITGATIALCAAVSLAAATSLSTADQALLSQINQAQYQALIYTASACGFEPSTTLSVTLLKSPGFSPIVDAVSRPTGPLPALDAKACLALIGS